MIASVSRGRPATSTTWTWASLLLVIAAALLIRLILRAGVVMIDDLGYSQAAHDLLSGRFRLQPWPGGQSRIGLYAPVALVYAIAGAGESSSLLFPLLSSLAGVVVAFATGRLVAGERAGLVAAFLWAISPIDVLAAGSLLPDGPMTTLGAAGVCLFLRAKLQPDKWARAGYTAASLCLAWAILIKPLALFLLAFVGLYLLVDRRGPLRGTAPLLAVAAGGLFLYAGYYALGAAPTVSEGQAVPFWTVLAATATDWTRRLLSEPAFLASTPLAIVAVAALLSRPEGRSWIAVLWAGTSFLIFEFASMSVREYMPIPATLRATQVLPIMLPLAIVSGVHLGRTVSERAAAWAVGCAAIVVGIGALVLRLQGPEVSLAVTGGTASDLPLATLAAVALGVATVAALASPSFIDRSRPAAGAVALVLLLAATGIASLHAAQMLVLGFRDAWHQNMPAVARFLRDQPETAIYVQNRILAARLNVASGFSLGFDLFEPASATGRLRVAPGEAGGIGDGSLVVIDDEMVGWSSAGGLGEPPSYFRTVPPDWALVFSEGTIGGHRTKVYRVSLAATKAALVAARQEAVERPGVASLSKLVGTAAAAHDYCTAASAWVRLEQRDTQAAAPFDAASMLRGCYLQNPGAFGPNLLRDGDFGAGTGAWGAGPDTQAERVVQTDASSGRRTLHVTFKGGSWAVMTQAVTLEPGTAYVYSMRVRTTVPIVALYWQADVGHPFAENQEYREWTTLVSAFVTPAWDGKPTVAAVSPVLMMAPGEAWVSDVRLVRFGG